jgi:hypothetical protein
MFKILSPYRYLDIYILVGTYRYLDTYILCCIHIFCLQKTHKATLFYRGTCIQGRRHLVTAATSVQSCAYRLLCVTIKLDSADI